LDFKPKGFAKHTVENLFSPLQILYPKMTVLKILWVKHTERCSYQWGGNG